MGRRAFLSLFYKLTKLDIGIERLWDQAWEGVGIGRGCMTKHDSRGVVSQCRIRQAEGRQLEARTAPPSGEGRVGRRMAAARMEMHTVIGCRAGVNGGRRPRWAAAAGE